MPLILIDDGFSVAFRKFIANGYERLTQPSGDQEYSLNGTPIVDGILYEPKFVWTIGAYVTKSEWQQLWLLYRRCERKRSTENAEFSITVADYVEPYIEDRTTRSRSLAPDGTVTSLSGGGIAYPALFHARMYEPKQEFIRNGLTPYIARFVLKELDSVPAT